METFSKSVEEQHTGVLRLRRLQFGANATEPFFAIPIHPLFMEDNSKPALLASLFVAI
jgi:hypothetical protein